MAWAQDWHTSAEFYQPKQVPKVSQRFGGGKELQSLIAKGAGTGKPFTGAGKAISSKYCLCHSFFHLRACFLSFKALLVP